MSSSHAPSPVFLIGAPRSGTSLLFKILCVHPDAAWFTNYFERMPFLPQLSGLVRIPPRRPDTRHRIWFGRDGARAYSYGASRPLLDRAFPMPVEGESIFRRCGIVQAGESGESAPRDEQIEALRATFDGVRRWSGRSVVVNKRIENNRRLPLLAEAFPDARFIEVVRDGRAAALSMTKVDWWDQLYLPFYDGRVSDWRAEGRPEIEAAARQWVQELEDVDAGRDGIENNTDAGRDGIENNTDAGRDGIENNTDAGRDGTGWLRLRYEDIIAEPRAMLDEMAAFAGLAPSAEWRGGIERLRFPDRNDEWRKSLSDSDVELIETIQGDLLRRDGYI